MRRPAIRRAPHPQLIETRLAAHDSAAGTRLGILSRKARSCHCFAHFLHSYDISCAFLRQKRQGNDGDRILLRESMPISCHREREKSFKVRPIRPKQAFRYPIDTLSIPDFSCFAAALRHTWPLLGLFWTESAPFLHTCAALPTRVLTPPLTSTLISARAGEVTRNEVPYSPKRPDTTVKYVVETPVQQRMNRVGMSLSHDDAQAMLALRARLLCGSRRDIAIRHFFPLVWDAPDGADL